MSGRHAPRAGSAAVRLATLLAPLSDTVVATTMLKGTARGSAGRPLSMLVAGPLNRVQWLVDRAFEDPPAREPLGHVPGWRLARTLRRMRGSADLVVARVARLSARPLGFDDDWLPVPEWIGMRLDEPFDLDAIARRSHSARDDIRRVRRDWRAETTHAAVDFEAFYRDMYLPFLHRRYRGEGFLRSARRLRRAFRRGGLLCVRRRGERLAGLVYETRRGTFNGIALGVQDGDEGWMRAGAVAALYVHMIDLARSLGCRSIDWHGSRPSLTDGVTRFKRKWGAVAYDRPQVLHTTLLRWERMSPAVLALLERMPLVFHDDEGLSAVAASGDGGTEGPAKTFGRLAVAGLRRFVVLAPATTAGNATDAEGCLTLSVTSVDSGPRALRAAIRDARVDAGG